MAYTKYSLTPANNNAAPPDGAPEGMLPSAVNDTMRDMMAQIRDAGDGIRNGTYTMTAPVITGGSVSGATGSFSTLAASGVATFSAGTVSAPAITTTGDTNTGIFFPAADTIAFTEGGVESMRIDSSGNVGIGTSSPSYKLHSTGTVGSGSIGTNGYYGLKRSSDGAELGSFNTDGTNIVTNAGTNIVFQRAGTESMRIDTSGNVGIGTSSPNYRLSVNGTGNFYNGVSGLGRVFFGDPADPNGYIGIYRSTLGPANWNTSGNGLNFASFDGYTFSTGVAVFGSQTERMRIDSSGNVGIGTSAALYSTAGRGILNLNGSSTALFSLSTGSSTSTSAYLFFSNPDLSITNATTTGVINFVTNSSERMRIDSSGNLLVGTTSSGNIQKGFQVLDYANGYYGRIGHNSSAASGDSYMVFQYNAGTIGQISQNGTTGVTYATTSDYRLKENIAPMTGALGVVSQLKPVTYNWKADGSSGQGFIAHELQAVVPDCVTGEKDAVDAEGKPVYQGIDTSFLVATLTAAIQELKAEFDAYKATHP